MSRRSRLYVAILMAACAALAIAGPLSAAETIVATVEARGVRETITDADMIFMIAGNVADDGDGMKTALAIVQMNEDEKEKLADRLIGELLFAAAARERKMQDLDEVRKMLRWQETQTLAGLYLAEVGAKWDLSESAARKYFDVHPEEFTEAEAVKIKYLMLPKEFDAQGLLEELRGGATFQSLVEKHKIPDEQVGTAESGWMEKGLVKREFERAFFAGDEKGFLEPVYDSMAVYVVEITDRRAERPLAWEEAKMEAVQRLQRYLLKQETDKLRKKYSVSMDMSLIRNLGKDF